MTIAAVQEIGFFIAFGSGDFPQGLYYEGDRNKAEDAAVPQRPSWTYIWSPNPDRPNYSDWQFDGHDADGGYWFEPPPEE